MAPDRNELFGWELNNPDYDAFDIQVIEVVGGCRNCEHVAECTMPCESVRCLAPKEGRIVGLGHVKEQGEPRLSYFALLNRDEVTFIRLSSPDHYWATASCISQEQVPAWALSHLDQKKESVSDAL
jgi:hypothetical protein